MGIYMGHYREEGSNPRLKVLTQPNTGLDSAARNSVVKILNHTLANEAVLTLKTRGALWNVRGAGFQDRRTLFDIQYEQLNGISEDVTKRARELGGFPIGSFVEILKNTRLDEQPGDVPDFMDLLADHESCVRFLREDAKKCSEEYEDESTFDFLIGIMRLHEKMAWMLRAYIEH